MSLLKDNFLELVERIKLGREFAHASFEPIFYLVFSPEEILAVKRYMPGWKSKLTNSGWDVHEFSIATAIQEIFDEMPAFIKKTWEMQDAKSPLNWQKTNHALAEALINKNKLQHKLESVLSQLEGQPNSMLLVTDIEALHPYLRIGSIESQLQGKFHVPTIFFYPGVRTGRTRLKFLGFYPEDGNYRSVHVGG